jgi:hypothetical protein
LKGRPAFYEPFSKLVADEATVRLRGTAFGLYHLVAGIALLGLTRLQPATA